MFESSRVEWNKQQKKIVEKGEKKNRVYRKEEEKRTEKEGERKGKESERQGNEKRMGDLPLLCR